MKNSLSSLLLLLALSGNAQTPVASANFNVTDINGNQHNLATYLSSGKTCIVEKGGLDCGPSWLYHKSEYLKDFYYAYGPDGSDEAMVFWVEQSSYNSIDDLQDPTGNMSLGNWVEGTPYPMILSNTMYSIYPADAVPRVFRICPNGEVVSYPQQNALGITNIINNQCNPMVGVQNHARIFANEIEPGFCGNTGKFKVYLKNYGINWIVSAMLVLKENGVVVSTKQISTVMPQFQKVYFEFDPVAINPGSTYTAEIQSVNGVPNRKAAFSVVQLPFHKPKVSSKAIKVYVHTYSDPQNMKWKITDSAGTTVFSGGPYTASSSGGAPNANVIKTHNITLPNVNDCYSVTLTATAGYGWKDYSAYQDETITPGIRIYSGATEILHRLDVLNFGSTLVFDNLFNVDTALSNEEVQQFAFKAYPNPSRGIINFKTQGPVNVTIFDIMGKQVYAAENIVSGTAVDISSLNNGIYMAKLTTSADETSVQKIILDK